MKAHLCLLPLLAASSFALAQTACTGHFTNRSNFAWSISGYDGGNSSLVIAPGATVDLNYMNATSITVSGDVPNRPYTRTFKLQASDGCYVIQFRRNPGFVTLNSPNPGDVVTCVGGC